MNAEIKEALEAIKKSLPEKNFKAQKALKIAECVSDTAEHLTKEFRIIAYHSKRTPRFIKRKKLSKKELALKQLMIACDFQMLKMELYKIMSQPIPKFKNGTPSDIHFKEL